MSDDHSRTMTRDAEEEEQRAARLAGLKLVGIGVLVGACNVGAIVSYHRLFPVGIAASVSCLFCGVAQAILGKPIDRETGKPPMRWTVVITVVGLAGLAIGIGIAETLKRGG